MGFSILGATIPYYGFFIALGIVCASFLSFLLCKKNSLDFNNCILILAYLVLGGFLGAKILYLFVAATTINWHLFFHNFKYFNIVIGSGFVFYGGFIGGAVILIFVKKVHKISLFPYLQIISPCVALAHAFGRIGCSLAGCCYGRETSGNFYFLYKNSLVAPNGVKFIPVQGIEAFFLFVFAAIFTILAIKKVKFCIPSLYIFLYAILRFVLEFYRGDAERGFLGWFSTSQFISLLLIVFCVGAFFGGFIKRWQKVVNER